MHPVGLGPGVTPLVHFIGTELRPDVVQSALRREPDLSGRGGEPVAGQNGTPAKLSPYDLEPDVAERCVQLAATLELPFAGVDLRLSPDGEVCCFEVNPSPAYSYYENHTGQPISTAVAALLAGASASPPSAVSATVDMTTVDLS